MYEINQRLILSARASIAVRDLQQPTFTGELSELFTLLQSLAPQRMQ